ncbi:MAG: four-carbon acid sugar kinase family protein [Roseomonas sp.]|nr:four-carbon acid sugar kinase family protein [Roseomonas sp.]MCA3313805.1 four-carbon acid sugar kinase family protein [Roseomonas sp.]MCA3317583.1 four-carbon acid sugar kinase family protein [Roseomonas sp.]MCA3319319.1 four-carbon acid sugar kinase family protein [Roseomonas sp.]MCA3341726.1 four-carbon acid sugar kinase family protein [Roseomonas sp.]
MPLLLGCIADDFTGATDLANTLVKGGMTAVQVIGVPTGPLPEADAIIIALKSRTAPVGEAVAQSLAACDALLAAGAKQIFWKYCSTFDSTDQGNIGPVADALLKRLGSGFALACPAFPTNGRTIYLGHLFVGNALLNESGMENHPLTPMTDANLVRVLGRQTDGAVGLVPFNTVEQGAAATRQAMMRLAEQGRRYAIVDAVTDQHLLAIGEAAAQHALITGGSGVAMGLPENFRRAGLLPARGNAASLPPMQGMAAVVAGSCSRATLGQIGLARDHVPVLELDALATPDAAALTAQALDWVAGKLAADRPVVIAASAPPEKVAALQAKLGRDAAGALIETAMAAIAEGLVAQGVGRLVVAGGETSGAVVQRLGVTALRIGPEIDPGVPWTFAEPRGLHLALKSGNFGARDFFLKAFDHG